jgi:hypothetical protein
LLAAGAAALLLVLLLTVDLQPVEDYYSSDSDVRTSGDIAVTVRISSAVLLDNMEAVPAELRDSGLLPENGIMLPETTVYLAEGSTVFDLLLKATRSHRIQMEYSGNPDGGISAVYIKSIGNLYEFSCGPLSGWMFRVNGAFSGTDSSGFLLGDGDTVEWLFTCDMGRDIGNDFNGGESD